VFTREFLAQRAGAGCAGAAPISSSASPAPAPPSSSRFSRATARWRPRSNCPRPGG
jgi:hypothetical protein